VRPLAIAASIALVALAVLVIALAMRARPGGELPHVTNTAPESPEPSVPQPPDKTSVPHVRPKPATSQRVVYHPQHRASRHAADTASTAPRVNTDEMLRVELQTRDPNVRIIWFVPKEDGAASPNEKSGL
jgi:hypothetical protein